ncbi:MAG: DUF2333 family protein [Candidatus Binatia bacterium]
MHSRLRGQATVAILVLVVVGVLGSALALHVTQRWHDVLPADALALYPPDREAAPGEVLAGTVIAIMEHELDGGTGWRPNDFLLWGPRLWADDNANRQLGIILAVRESVRVFKDHLTKVSSTEYDKNLVVAETAFRNDAERLWLPSAESRFREGVAALRRYIEGLHATPPTSKALTRRNVELIRLLQSWGDLLGDAHANLFKEQEADGRRVPLWHADDYFYHAQGVAHVVHHLLRAVQREYQEDLAGRETLRDLVVQAGESLGRAATLEPIVVLDGGPESLIANHRHNLDVYVVDARQKLYSIREELEK